MTTYHQRVSAARFDGTPESAGRIGEWLRCPVTYRAYAPGAVASIDTGDGVVAVGGGWWVVRGTGGTLDRYADAEFRARFQGAA